VGAPRVAVAMGAAKSACAGGCFSGLRTVRKQDDADWLDPFSDASATAAQKAEPLRVAVAGAAGQIGYALLPMIASGEMFGKGQRVILQCLDLNLPQVIENMRGLEMELQDGDFPLLREAFFTVDDAKAFKDADYVILLGAFPQQEGKERREIMEKNTMIFRTMGHAIETCANKECKVLTVAHPACTNALLCAYYAPSRPKENFFALSRLEQNRVAGQIAQRASASADDVRNVAVWGVSPSARRADLDTCTVKGKPLFSALYKEDDRKWLEQELAPDVLQRGASIHQARKATCALSAARAIVGHMRDLHCGTRPGIFSSMGVWSDGNEYGIADGLVFSMPVVCQGRGRWHMAGGLVVGKETRERLKEAERELLGDRELARELGRKHGLQLAQMSKAAPPPAGR